MFIIKLPKCCQEKLNYKWGRVMGLLNYHFIASYRIFYRVSVFNM